VAGVDAVSGELAAGCGDRGAVRGGVGVFEGQGWCGRV
jgi:hypothetical protein